MDDVWLLHEKRRDLCSVLPCEQLGKLRGRDLDARLERLHRRLEIVPGIGSPRVILVDSGDSLYVLVLCEQVTCGRNVVHSGVRAGAKQILIACILENARCAAIEKDGELLQFVRNRRDGETVTGGDA